MKNISYTFLILLTTTFIACDKDDEVSTSAEFSLDIDGQTIAFAAENSDPMLSHINVGTGVDCTIRELAETMKTVTGYDGELVFDSTKPDGTPRKLMDVSKLEKLGWKASIPLKDGLEQTYEWFLNQSGQIKSV